MKRLSDLLFRNGIRRGLLGGNRVWTVVAIVLGGVRVVRRLSRPGDGVVYREELRPGEALLISHLES